MPGQADVLADLAVVMLEDGLHVFVCHETGPTQRPVYIAPDVQNPPEVWVARPHGNRRRTDDVSCLYRAIGVWPGVDVCFARHNRSHTEH